jgi:hypothetical protein
MSRLQEILHAYRGRNGNADKRILSTWGRFVILAFCPKL